MNIQIRVDTTPAQRVVGEMARQIPYAVSRSLNEVADLGQHEERTKLDTRFILRRPQFILRTIKRNAGIYPSGDFSDKQHLVAIVRVDAKADFLAKFEAGGEKTARSGGSVSVPIAARPNALAIVPKRLRPRELHFKKHTTKRGKIQEKGDYGTFILRNVPVPGIYQRVGHVRGSIRLLYAFRPSVEIKPILGLEAEMRTTVEENWKRVFTAWFKRALETAR